MQYTTNTGSLAARAWTNVSGLANSPDEPLTAAAVSPDGTVVGDVHPRGLAAVRRRPASEIRLGFADPCAAGTCSTTPTGPCNHYRVGEPEVHADGGPAPAPAGPRRA